MQEDPWQILGIARDAGVDEIRRAYVALIKCNRPDENAQGFQRLRDAYEFLLAYVGQTTPAHASPATASLVSPPSETVAPAEPDGDSVRPADAVAREILDACAPVHFEPDSLRRLVGDMYEEHLAAREQLQHWIASFQRVLQGQDEREIAEHRKHLGEALDRLDG